MPYQTSHTHSESGNVLIYILIGIVLLAALNFAFSQGADTGSDSTVDKGEAVIAASDIIRYAGNVAETVRDLQMREGCSENELSFHHESGDGYDYGDATTDCTVFDYQGGGMSYEAPKDKWLVPDTGQNEHGEWFFPNSTCVEDVGRGNGGCQTDGIDNEEMIIALPWIDKQICVQINKKLNVDNPSGEPPVEGALPWPTTFPKYTGNFSDGKRIDSSGSLPAGLKNACFESDNLGGYHYYHVIVAR